MKNSRILVISHIPVAGDRLELID